MYLMGFTPWDRAVPRELLDMIEGPERLPTGRSLDLGSGLGRKAIFMAEHGWQVTGVEAVPRALREARRRAQAARVAVDFREGDVTSLGKLGLAPGYTFLFDFGCYHGLKATERSSYTDGVTALAASGATLLMMAFTRPIRAVTAGVTEPELRDRFGGGWDLLWSRPNDEPGTAAMTRASAAWFCMARR
jgi:SAM-dependent methyltransferase